MKKLVQQLSKFDNSFTLAKTPWSWGRMDDSFFHSFGRAQDRIPPPTRKNLAIALVSKRKRSRIGNEKNRQARRPVNDH